MPFDKPAISPREAWAAILILLLHWLLWAAHQFTASTRNRAS